MYNPNKGLANKIIDYIKHVLWIWKLPACLHMADSLMCRHESTNSISRESPQAKLIKADCVQEVA